MSKKQKFYCKVGQAVCNMVEFTLLCGFMTSMWVIANLLANMI